MLLPACIPRPQVDPAGRAELRDLVSRLRQYLGRLLPQDARVSAMIAYLLARGLEGFRKAIFGGHRADAVGESLAKRARGRNGRFRLQ